jgi:hypothetical protein
MAGGNLGWDINQTFEGTNVTQTGSTSVSPANQAVLDAMTKTLGSSVTNGEYSKDAAINDTMGPIQQMITKMLQDNMPSITGNEKSAGGYNDTTTKLMSNDLQSRMDQNALAQVLQSIQSYANIQNTNAQTAAGAAKISGTTTTNNSSSPPGADIKGKFQRLTGIGGGGGTGCFITTAAVKYCGLSDDGVELTVLRKFRDSWMQEYYPEELAIYKAKAPALVAAIEARKDAAAVFTSLMKSYIWPAVIAITLGKYEEAHSIYKCLYKAATIESEV